MNLVRRLAALPDSKSIRVFPTIGHMSALDDILKGAQRARLIPTVAPSRKEERIVSILLSTLTVVRPLARELLNRCGVRLGKTSRLHNYIEVVFPGSGDADTHRPDGVLRVVTRKVAWTALLEAKIDKAPISEEQVHRYAELARRFGANAVITISNELVSVPTHVPYFVPKRMVNHVDFFHFSWISILTRASLILRDMDGLDTEQAFILGEMVRFFEHPSSGVRRFDQMNPEWRGLVLGVRSEAKFKRSSPEIENTVASWFQEERDICLILNRRITKRVALRLTRKYILDPELRLREACDRLIECQELRSVFTIQDAANDLEVTANLQRRTVSCSMVLNAPRNKQRASARINWLLRQMKRVENANVIVRAHWPGRAMPTQAPLAQALEDGKCLESDQSAAAPLRFEVIMLKELGVRFSGVRTFIEDLEDVIPEFYDLIGQKLRAWVPPPPPIEKHDPIERTEDPATSSGADGSSSR